MRQMRGFTLLELMVAVIIAAILAAMAIPVYRQYIRRADEGKVMQQMQYVAESAERHKARNFNYKNFTPSANWPVGYTNSLTIESNGLYWTMKLTTADARKYSFLMDSRGNRCKTKTAASITNTGCGSTGEKW